MNSQSQFNKGYHWIHPIFIGDPTGVVQVYTVDLKFHNPCGPAIIYANGSTKWYLEGLLHREGGPAIEFTSTGDKFYFKHGKRHREDGPANIWGDGDKEWYINDQLHRMDGPAIEYANGKVEYWENGIRIKK